MLRNYPFTQKTLKIVVGREEKRAKRRDTVLVAREVLSALLREAEGSLSSEETIKAVKEIYAALDRI